MCVFVVYNVLCLLNRVRCVQLISGVWGLVMLHVCAI